MIIDGITPPKQLLYFSPVAWDSYAQRPHYFVRHFLDRGGDRVLWVEPYPNRLPVPSDLRRRDVRRTAAVLEPRVTVIRVPAWPVEPLPGGAALNRTVRWRGVLARLAGEMASGESTIGVGRPSALALLALDRYPAHARFYDAMDDFPEFYGGLSRRSMRRREDAVVAAVDRVYASSDALMAKFARRGIPATLVANAYAMQTLPPYVPREPGAATVFGYIGTVGRWFDWGVVGRLAAAFPAAEVRIVGPVHSGPPGALPANVRFTGECPQPAAVEHLRAFACGLIPFRQSPLTAAVDPIKYYEYRGMGLPVLSTRFGQMAARGTPDGVFMVEGNDVEAPARAALAHRADAAAVARFRAENDWETRLQRAALFPELGALPV